MTPVPAIVAMVPSGPWRATMLPKRRSLPVHWLLDIVPAIPTCAPPTYVEPKSAKRLTLFEGTYFFQVTFRQQFDDHYGSDL
jgi:hypothetical protein